MEVKYLKMIKTVAECGTLTKAAENMYLSQSALSHQLKELESYIGGQVFYRVNKRMVLSPAGEQLLETATKVLDTIESGEVKLRQMLAGDQAFIRISTQCYTFYHWLSGVLSNYKQVYPNVDIRIVPEATYEALSWLTQGKLDVAILNYKPDYKDVVLTELFKDELVVVMSPTHSLASGSYINHHDLAAEHYITYRMKDGINGVTYDQVFTANDIAPAKMTRVQLTEAIIEMVKAGMGVSLLARWAVKKHLESKELVALPLGRKGTERSWYAATLRNPKPPKYMTSFLNCLKKGTG